MTDLKSVNILLVEDENELCLRLAKFLRRYFGVVNAARNGSLALESVAQQRPDVVVSDIRMPVMDGIELATQLRDNYPDLPIIFCTAFTETCYLLKAIELGVSALIPKPIDTDHLLRAIRQATLPLIQRRQIEVLNSGMAAMAACQLGKGKAMQRLATQAAQVAVTDYSVLLLGETGVGKSHLASIIHNLSPRREQPFITVNLGALPEQLAESELFGHSKGAFTGADGASAGLVAAAAEGTLFFDEIDAAPLSLQVKILRLVEQKQYIPIGKTTPEEAKIRIIAASNRNLGELVASGKFRDDLYYRLADLVITIPPLREILEEIMPLTQRIIQETCTALRRNVPKLPPGLFEHLSSYQWHGNIRELKSVIRRTLLVAESTIEIRDIMNAINTTEINQLTKIDKRPVATLNQAEKEAITNALLNANGKLMAASRILDIDYSRFKRLLAKHSINGY